MAGSTYRPRPTVYASPAIGAGARQAGGSGREEAPGNSGASEIADKLTSADPHRAGSPAENRGRAGYVVGSTGSVGTRSLQISKVSTAPVLARSEAIQLSKNEF